MKNINKFIQANPRFQFEIGTVGFGRECVGILDTKSSTYLDYLEYDRNYDVKREHTVARDNAPENAYHKHHCLAVLMSDVSQEEATAQLDKWVADIMESGYNIVDMAPSQVNLMVGNSAPIPCIVDRV